MIRSLKLLGMGWIILFLLLGSSQQGGTEEKYKVKPGDTLYGISQSFEIHIEALKKANALGGDAIKPNQILMIPSQREKKRDEVARRPSNHPPTQLTAKNVQPPLGKTGSYVIQKGDTLSCISGKVGIPIEEIKKMNHLGTSSLKIGQVLHLSRDRSRGDEESEELGDGEEMAEALQPEGEDPVASTSLEKWSNPEERNLFIRVVKNFLGVPYKLGGSTLKGIDCSAFVKKIYEIFNTQIPRTTREQFSIGKKVEKGQLEEGDLVFFRRRGNSSHVGIYIGDNQFVHASSSNREVKIDDLDTPYYNKRFLKGVRLKELEKEI
jgi:peptidoglycan endopeptidase LytE